MDELRRVWTIPSDAVRELAASLGHRDIVVRPTRSSRWLFECACGHISQSRNLPRQAATLAMSHLERSILDWRAAGMPDSWLVNTPTEPISESQSSDVA